MADDSPPGPSALPLEAPFSPRSSSFIYPVRSLLSAIQPVGAPRSKSADNLSSLASAGRRLRPSLSERDAGIAGPREGQEVGKRVDAFLAQTAEHVTRTFDVYSEAPNTLPFSFTSDTLNFRHFPAEQGDPGVPRTFSTRYPVRLASAPAAVAVPQSGQDHILTPILTDASPTLLPIIPSPEQSPSVVALGGTSSQVALADTTSTQESVIGDDSLLFSGESLQIPGSTLLLDTPLSVEPAHEAKVAKVTTASESANDLAGLPFNVSQYGLVHLPPLPLSGPSEWWVESDSSSNRPSSVAQDSGSIKSILAPTPCGASTSYSETVSSREGCAGPAPISYSGPCESDTTPSSKASFTEGTEPRLGANSAPKPEEYTTFRFQYAVDECGNHVVVGREGQLTRCEDEPIRTPGAVQGFGVLIAVDDREDTLVVRQVSENSTELLGLSPRYLFSLECFTDTLPESSAESLWDNIQFLTDPTHPASAKEDNSPHVFTLSGWGEPGSAPTSNGSEGKNPSQLETRRSWTCWCAVHRVQFINKSKPGLIVMEFELEADSFNPLYPLTSARGRSLSGGEMSSLATPRQASTWPPAEMEEQDDWTPSAEDILESTTSHARPLLALQRLRRLAQNSPSPHESRTSCPPSSPLGGSIPFTHPTSPSVGRKRRRGINTTNSGTIGMMDLFAVMTQVNQQLGAAQDLDAFLGVTVGVIKDLTQFHRVLVYQFDKAWNGQVVAELVDRGKTKDLYRGLYFPAGDIPKQARDLYTTNKVRVLYDRSQSTARIVVRDKRDLEESLDMTHCYLRAMSPIHLKYLENMGVRASMSVSIMVFDQLWGLVACHSYGDVGMRVSFPMRQMLGPLSQSISRNIERLSYAKRLHTRQLINTFAFNQHSSGYIVSSTDDLLGVFDADFGILVIGKGAKILGPNQYGQEILIMAEYLRLKQFDTIQASQAVINDFPDLQLTTGFEVIAGLLYVPLSRGGKDFIAFLRRGQLHDVHWAGKPCKDDSHGTKATLEPRKSFKIWSETVTGQCRVWTDEQLEAAGVLALVCGKFIEVWRQKQNALQATKITNILLSNAAHEVRTPLNHIINYLEMAMNSSLDNETRDNLVQSHAASKSLLFAINDLLDLARLESGHETSFNKSFDLHAAIEDAVHIYQREASRRNIEFVLDLSNSPKTIVGDPRKIRTVVQNSTANALKCTEKGSISVSCKTLGEVEEFKSPTQAAIEITVADTGCGIEEDKLANLFREFEQVESSEPWSNVQAGVGLGLAVVARIIDQLGGQLRVESEVGVGSIFSFIIPLAPSAEGPDPPLCLRLSPSPARPPTNLPPSSQPGFKIEDLVEEISLRRLDVPCTLPETAPAGEAYLTSPQLSGRDVEGAGVPAHPTEVEYLGQEAASAPQQAQIYLGRQAVDSSPERSISPSRSTTTEDNDVGVKPTTLRILIIEDNDINLAILAKRLTTTGHTVVKAANGQEGIDVIKSDTGFDAILMDVQMPIMGGFEATERIRTFEKDRTPSAPVQRLSQRLNGRIPIFAVSASLVPQQRKELIEHGMDGWILKPIDFKRLRVILKGVTDVEQRKRDVYHSDGNWEAGGWLQDATDAPQGAADIESDTNERQISSQ